MKERRDLPTIIASNKNHKYLFQEQVLIQKRTEQPLAEDSVLEYVLCSIKYNTLLHLGAELSLAKGNSSDLSFGLVLLRNH